jgi:hypothetical protein
MKSKILISIVTLLISSLFGVILVNSFWGIFPFEGMELWGFYLVEFGMIMIMPVLGLNNLWWFGIWDSFITFSLAISSLVWLIYLLMKSERKWIVAAPIVIWVLIGSWNTFLALVASV